MTLLSQQPPLQWSLDAPCYFEVQPIDFAVISAAADSPSAHSLAQALSTLTAAGSEALATCTCTEQGLTVVVPLSAAPPGEKPWAALGVVSPHTPFALAGLCGTLASAGLDAVLHAVNPSATYFLVRRSRLAAAVTTLVGAGCAVRPLGTELNLAPNPQGPCVLPSSALGAWREIGTSAAEGAIRLQVRVGLFVEIRTPSHDDGSQSQRVLPLRALEASRCGYAELDINGNISRRAMVDFQPPVRLPEGGGPRLCGSGIDGEWEQLADADAPMMALELEDETPVPVNGPRRGVWLFVGNRFARVIGPPIGCRHSIIASTLSRSLSALQRLRGPEVDAELRELYEAVVGEVECPGLLRVVRRAGGAAEAAASCDILYDASDAEFGGTVELHQDERIVIHSLASGGKQRWRIVEMTCDPFSLPGLGSESVPAAEPTPVQSGATGGGGEGESQTLLPPAANEQVGSVALAASSDAESKVLLPTAPTAAEAPPQPGPKEESSSGSDEASEAAAVAQVKDETSNAAAIAVQEVQPPAVDEAAKPAEVEAVSEGTSEKEKEEGEEDEEDAEEEEEEDGEEKHGEKDQDKTSEHVDRQTTEPLVAPLVSKPEPAAQSQDGVKSAAMNAGLDAEAENQLMTQAAAIAELPEGGVIYAAGARVKYWSQTVRKWISATVLRRNEDGTFDLDLKRRAQPQCILPVSAKLLPSAPPANKQAGSSTGEQVSIVTDQETTVMMQTGKIGHTMAKPFQQMVVQDVSDGEESEEEEDEKEEEEEEDEEEDAEDSSEDEEDEEDEEEADSVGKKVSSSEDEDEDDEEEDEKPKEKLKGKSEDRDRQAKREKKRGVQPKEKLKREGKKISSSEDEDEDDEEEDEKPKEKLKGKSEDRDRQAKRENKRGVQPKEKLKRKEKKISSSEDEDEDDEEEDEKPKEKLKGKSEDRDRQAKRENKRGVQPKEKLKREGKSKDRVNVKETGKSKQSKGSKKTKDKETAKHKEKTRSKEKATSKEKERDRDKDKKDKEKGKERGRDKEKKTRRDAGEAKPHSDRKKQEKSKKKTRKDEQETEDEVDETDSDAEREQQRKKDRGKKRKKEDSDSEAGKAKGKSKDKKRKTELHEEVERAVHKDKNKSSRKKHAESDHEARESDKKRKTEKKGKSSHSEKAKDKDSKKRKKAASSSESVASASTPKRRKR